MFYYYKQFGGDIMSFRIPENHRVNVKVWNKMSEPWGKLKKVRYLAKLSKRGEQFKHNPSMKTVYSDNWFEGSNK